MKDPIERQVAIDAMCELMHHWFGGDPKDEVREINRELKKLPSAQPESCDECKHLGKWENEVEYGYPSPCTHCKRRARDHYER